MEITTIVDIPSLLDCLADLHAQRDALMLDKQALVDQVLTPEIRDQLEAIDAEFSEKADVVGENISLLEDHVKAAVKTSGCSFRGQFLQAVYSRGRESVDMKMLKGYAQAHPEINNLIRVGEPSVSIRLVGR